MEIDIELTSTQGTCSGISLLERGYNISQCGVAPSERALRMSGRGPGLGYFQQQNQQNFNSIASALVPTLVENT